MGNLFWEEPETKGRFVYILKKAVNHFDYLPISYITMEETIRINIPSQIHNDIMYAEIYAISLNESYIKFT